MSIDKQYLREVAKQATGAHERINAISADDIFDISLHHDGAQLDADITDLNSFNEAANPATVLALLDELEAKEKQRAAANKVVVQQDIELQELRQRITELEAQEVKLPLFDGYVPHIAAELQAAFRIACADAGISIKGE